MAATKKCNKANIRNFHILMSNCHKLARWTSNSSVSQILRYLAASGSQWPNREHAFHRGPACDTGTLGLVWLTARLAACADLNWSALVNHIGIHPLPATQPTLIGHALYIKPRPSQFSVLHVPPCMHGNGKFLCAIFNWLKLFYCNGVTSPKPLS